MSNSFVVLIVSLIVLSVCIAGCESNAPSVQSTPQPTTLKTPSKSTTMIVTSLSTPEESQLSTLEPSQMALQLSDIPSGYTIRERSELTRSDIDPNLLNLGWKKGYYVSFSRSVSNDLEFTDIDQRISIYPVESITKILQYGKEKEIKISQEDQSKFEELSDPKIGDHSQAFRIPIKVLGREYKMYIIEFIKKDVFVYQSMAGTYTDYETLKDTAKITATKIK